MTQITEIIKYAAKKENVPPKFLARGVANGTIVVPANFNHRNIMPIGIGKGLRVKVNANIGTSKSKPDSRDEMEKLRLCIRYKADTVMDLSTGGNLEEIRKTLIRNSQMPFGTVPVYQTTAEKKSIEAIRPEDFINTIERQAKQGVDFMTVHSGLLKEYLPAAKKRVIGIVSRGGAIIARWMMANDEQNPFYTMYDDILDIASKYNVTLSLGDGLRPGCIADATDRAQLSELKTLGELTLRARKKKVQAMVEGPGHVPLNQIKKNIMLQKRYCHNAPFYVLGPLVTDIAPGYDHITSAIGGAIAAYHGADFLCYVTPSEHLCLPTIDDVKQGIIASRIAAHAADIAKGVKGARDSDDMMARARFDFDWKKQFSLSIEPETPRIRRGNFKKDRFCSMCGEELCAMNVFKGDRQKPFK